MCSLLNMYPEHACDYVNSDTHTQGREIHFNPLDTASRQKTTPVFPPHTSAAGVDHYFFSQPKCYASLRQRTSLPAANTSLLRLDLLGRRRCSLSWQGPAIPHASHFR